jgi:hypothetical protein
MYFVMHCDETRVQKGGIMKYIRLVFVVGLITLAACGTVEPPTPSEFGPVPITDQNRALAERLRAELLDMQSRLEPEMRENAQFVDFDSGYAYDAQLGLVRLNLGRYDPATNLIRFEDQSVLPSSNVMSPRTDLRATAEATACAPYRQVKSIKNFLGVQADLNVSTPAGLKASEGAYNYFAAYFDNNQPGLEGGIVSSSGNNQYATGKWYGFMRGAGVSGSYTILRDLNSNDTRTVPAKGSFDAGRVYMQLLIDAPSRMAFLLRAGGFEKVYGASVPYARRLPGTQNVQWGRTTSLLTNSGAANSGLSEWSNVRVGQYISATVTQWDLWAQNFTTTGFPKSVVINPSTTGPCPTTAAVSVDDTWYVPDYIENVIISQR